MAKGPEAKVKKKVQEILTAHGAYSFMPATHGYGTSGVPDIVVCYYGVFIGIETKATDKNKPTKLQIKNAREIVGAGGIALLIHAENIRLVAETLALVETGNLEQYPDYWHGLLDEEEV